MQTDANRPPFWVPNETIPIRDLSNREFLDRFARPGRIGLATGPCLADPAGARVQRPQNEGGLFGLWTHAFVFEGTRVDGNHWVVASDLALADKQVQLGAQENRLDRYYDEKAYPAFAILDFGLSQEQTLAVVKAALDLLARRTRYTLRELLGKALAVKNPALRRQEAGLARDESFYCSAFVAHLFQKVGLGIMPGITAKNTTPDDLARSPLPHTTYLLSRGKADATEGQLARVRKSLATKVVPKAVSKVGTMGTTGGTTGGTKVREIRRATTLKRGRG
jgi:hypothetical protein